MPLTSNAARQHLAREPCRGRPSRSRTFNPSCADRRRARPAAPRCVPVRCGKSSSHSGSSCCRAAAGVGLGDVVGVGARRLPCPRHDLRLAEHRPQLVDDGRLDLARRHPAHRARSCAVLQHGLADVVAVEPVSLAGMGRRKGPRHPDRTAAPLAARASRRGCGRRACGGSPAGWHGHGPMSRGR